MQLQQLIPVLQVAIGPVILISGVGLLLLSMTNRLGRTIDRSRQLVDLQRRCGGQERQRFDPQLKILWQRARLLQIAITFACASALLACALIITLFVGALMSLEIGLAIVLIFISCMSAIIGALVYFIRDIDLSLKALALELDIAS